MTESPATTDDRPGRLRAVGRSPSSRRLLGPRVPRRGGRPARRDRVRRDLGVRAAHRGREDGADAARTRSSWRGWPSRSSPTSSALRAPAHRARRRPVRGDGAVRHAVRRLPPPHRAVGLARGPDQGVRRRRARRGLLPRDRRVPGRGHPRRSSWRASPTPGSRGSSVDRVRAAIAADPRVGGRLALWGRRLMGEALSQAQRVAAERDALSALLAGGVDRPGHGPGRDRPAVHPAHREPLQPHAGARLAP